MPPSEIAFHVKAENADTELFLVDSDFALVGESGVGEKTWNVAPGPYKVKARRGTAIVEKLVLVRPGAETYVVPHIRFASPSPVEGTAWRHEHHVAADEAAATRVPDVTHGKGSAIVVMMREWTEQEFSGERPIVDPSRGLSIHTVNGDFVVELEQSSQKDLTWEPCATCHIAVAPGPYRLRLESPDRGRVELMLIASPGWQTHVYLLTECARAAEQRRVDLVNASISLRKPEQWGTCEADWQLEELARQALIDDRTSITDVLKARITTDAPPMLALYGAHVLVREAQKAYAAKKTDVDHKETVAAVVQRLRETLGTAHPDVEALALGAGNSQRRFRFTVPPMLRAGWLRLLAASVGKPSLFAPDSFALRIADRLWGDGPWLLWTAPEDVEEFDRSSVWTARAAQLIDEYVENQSGDTVLHGPPPTWFQSVRQSLADLRFQFVKPELSPFPESKPVECPPPPTVDIDITSLRKLLEKPDLRRKLVREMGLPMKSIRDWVDKLE